MSPTIDKAMLFTLSACPMGRSMNTVIREIMARRPELAYEVVYVDVDAGTTNRYRVKTNPTTLFLDAVGKELYRSEGFRETEEVWRLIERIEEGTLRAEGPREENRETHETMTIYLYRQGEIVPVHTTYVNLTSVKAPRITAVQQLLRTRPEGYDNPFPPGTALEQVSFKDGFGVVTFRIPSAVHVEASDRMKALVARTLAAYGIDDVELEWVH